MKKNVLLLLFLLLTACLPSVEQPAGPSGMPEPVFTVTPTPFQPQLAADAASETPPMPTTATLPRVWLDDRLPQPVRDAFNGLDWQPASTVEQADFWLKASGPGQRDASCWVYALIAPFTTLRDGVSLAQVKDAGMTLYLVKDALPVLPDDAPARVLDTPEDVLTVVRSGQGWGILPFDALQPDVKVIQIDGDSPLHNDFKADSWPLTVCWQPQGTPSDGFILPPGNRDPQKLTTLVMTGVTALVRATAAKMEENGVLYPAQDISAWLRQADITHISNEIPFYDRCPPPSAYQSSLRFCSDPRYLELLQAVGTDVVELTGNHFQDYGNEATLQTLDMYDAAGWPYFGGGRNLQDARQPALLEHNGNHIAFIGCNMPGPDFAWATDDRPGAAPCGDYAWIEAAIQDLKAQGYFVVATFQYQEYYVHFAPENQVRDFGRLATAGADIVSGSQAHFPQAMAWQNETFIHYGLGNLFFDQMDIPVAGTRRAFIDRYTIYDGRLIGVELLPTMLEDWSRPRPMTAEEREALLRDVFTASGWPVYP